MPNLTRGNINSFNDVVAGLQHNIQWCQQALRYLGGTQMQGAAAGITQRGKRGRQASAAGSTGTTRRRGRRKTTQQVGV
jgi:hypothetical protein